MYKTFSLIMKGSLTSVPNETSLCSDNILKTDYTNYYFLKHCMVWSFCLWFNNMWLKIVANKLNQAPLKQAYRVCKPVNRKEKYS